MQKRKFSLKLHDCINIYDLPGVISQAQMEVDWLTAIDIAHNKNSVAHIVEGARLAEKHPPKIEEYNSAVKKVMRSEKKSDRDASLRRLNSKYEKDIEAENKRMQKMRDERDKKVFDVELLPIKSSAISGESKFATLVAEALLPILDFGETKKE